MSEENGEKKIKVTDRRMFTADGELRDDYRHLDETAVEEPRSEVEAPSETTVSEPPAPEPSTPVIGEIQSHESPGGGQVPQKPAFLDLVAMLAEPVPIYLGDVQLGEGGPPPDRNLARFHIDLLDVLREKTEGNLESQEKAVLEDLIYQLRMRFVHKRE